MKIKRIYIQTPIFLGRFKLSDDIGFYDNFWIMYRSMTFQMSAYQQIIENADLIADYLVASTTPSNFNINSTTISANLVIKKERIINAGNAAVTGYIQLICDQNAGGSTNPITLSIEYEGNATWTASNTLSSGSGGSSSGGGGCWSGDTLFYDKNHNAVPFNTFRVGDLIETVNGLEPIEAIERSGLHEVIQISPNVWITPLQPYKISDIEKRINEFEYQHNKRRFVDTYDCHVKSIWLKTVNDILIKDKKI